MFLADRLCRRPVLGLLALLAAWLLACGPTWAREAAPATADPALEARVMRLATELRCLVCQNETIAASHADLAVDLRNQVRDMLRQGQSDADVLRYMRDRYGDFVLYRPLVQPTTWVLWYGPAVLLVVGLVALWWMLRRRNRLAADQFDADADDAAAADSSAGPDAARSLR